MLKLFGTVAVVASLGLPFSSSAVRADTVPKGLLPSICGTPSAVSAAVCVDDGNGQAVPFATLYPGQHNVVPTLPFGTTSVTVAAGDDSRIVNAVQPGSSPFLGNPIVNFLGAKGVTAYEFTGGSLGTTWTSEYHANWNVVQTQVPYNPTEWQVYSSAGQGVAQVIAGTNQVVRTYGNDFDASWVGHPYFYWNGIGYIVTSVTDQNHLTVSTTSGGSVSWGSTASNTFYYVVTTATNVCNVSGSTVTYVSGQKFIGFFDNFYINGAPRSASFTDLNHMALKTASLSPLTNATCIQYVNIANELSNIRLQGLAGDSEENFVITETPYAAIIQTAYKGLGKYRPILISNGEQPVGNGQIMAGFYPNGTLGQPGFITFGGGVDYNNEAVAIQPNSNNRNFLFLQGGTPAIAPSIAARGTDATVGLGLDVQGANTTSFTSHTFGNIEFQVFGNGGASWLATGSSMFNAPLISAQGPASNIGVGLQAKGTAPITINNEVVVGSSSVSGAALSLQNSAGTCTLTPTSSTASFACSSDERLKTDIRGASGAIGWLQSFQVRDYRLKTDGQFLTGPIAQEVRIAHPEMVHEQSDGLLAVDGPSPWKMMAAMQAMQNEISRLQIWLAAVVTVSFVTLSGILLANRRSVRT